jgi:hypothetical protein
MPLEFTTSYAKDSFEVLKYYKRLGERAMAQAPDEALAATLDNESNSIAIVVKHLAGNMRSRWTDFLTSDGEKTMNSKPRRQRAQKFWRYGKRGGSAYSTRSPRSPMPTWRAPC